MSKEPSDSIPDGIPAGFACLKMIAAAFARLEKARLAKKLKAARDRRQRRTAKVAFVGN